MTTNEAAVAHHDPIIRFSWVTTAVFVVSAVLSVMVEPYRPVSVVVALVLFAVGIVAFLAGFLRAVDRSRYELIGVGGLYFLVGCAPVAVRRHLLGAWVVQVVVAFAAAAMAPFTSVAFAILVPVLGLGLAGLWGARHGTFPAREPADAPAEGDTTPDH